MKILLFVIYFRPLFLNIYKNSNFQNFLILVIENNLDLETRLTLRRSNQKADFNLPKITFQSSVNAIDFVFQRFQVNIFM